MVQLEFTPSVEPHAGVSLKLLAFVPVNPMLVIVKVALPVFDKVKVAAELDVAAGWVGNAKLLGERLAIAPVTEKFVVFDAPPPGAGFVTTTA
jgi:hypothetical protein